MDQMWTKLGVKNVVASMVQERNFGTPIERMVFAMVANRALAPSSKLHIEHWVSEEVQIEDLDEVEVHQLYRAMDFLIEASEPVQRQVFFSVADLLNLEVDLLFLDTTSSYFEIEGEDEDNEVGEGLRKRGHSKDKRSDLAQVVIALPAHLPGR